MKLISSILAACLILPVGSWAQETTTAELPSKQSTALEAQHPGEVKSESANISGLAPGDVLTVRMFDFPDISGSIEIHVSADGTIHLPYAGTLSVAGKSPDQVQQAITDSLKTRGIVRDPNVTVETVSAANLNVTVIGQVASPRSVPLYAPAPLTYVLSLVGGITGLAGPNLTIIHNNGEVPTSVVYDPGHSPGSVLNMLVLPGDIINVSSRGVFFMAGEVNRPGVYPLGGALSVGQISPVAGMGVVQNLTLLQGLAQAGGVTAIAARSKMHILRTVDGKREDIVVDQVKLSKGDVADPLLRPNDIVYLPPSYFRQQTNNLFATALSGLYAATSLKSANIY